ncbi:hypothetical protein PROVRETT_09051 [Providencia rettgeri DSM 1131]|nr:hypothetical protein PROVRETT_09051 [Providencia rettgeri DSM 1131]
MLEKCCFIKKNDAIFKAVKTAIKTWTHWGTKNIAVRHITVT